MAGWIAGAAWGGLVAMAAGASFAEHNGLHAAEPAPRGSVWVPLELSTDAPALPGLPARGAHVYLDVHPDAAGVEVDGQSRGRAHGFVASPLSLGPGVHRLDIRHPGFKPLRLVVDVSGQQAYVLRATLEPSDGEREEPGSGYFVVPRR